MTVPVFVVVSAVRVFSFSPPAREVAGRASRSGWRRALHLTPPPRQGWRAVAAETAATSEACSENTPFERG